MEQMKPIFSYFGFLSRSVLKKKSIWIVFSIFLICGFIVSLIPSFVGTENGTNIYSYTSCFTIILPISISIQLIASCFCGALSFLIPFKDGESDGMELLIASKPITRLQIILSRILFFSIMSIFIGLLTLTFAGISYEVLHAQSISYMGVTIFEGFLYEKGLYLGGMFGSSLLGFLIFGFISAGISLVASGKATRIIAVSTIAISGIAGTQLSSLGNIIPSGITSKFVDVTNEVLNENYKGRRVSEVDTTQSYNNDIITGFDFAYYNLDTNSLYIDDTLYGGILINQYSGINCTVKGSDGSNYNTSISSSSLKSSIWKEIAYRLGDSVNASGVTAVNYLNPLSALISIASSKPLSFSNGIPYNISASNIKMVSDGQFIFEASPADPSWAVALMWVGVLGLLGVGITFGYLRKDFK